MAAFPCSASAAGVASTTSAKTVLQLVAPTNQRLRVTRLLLGLHGTSATAEPVLVELVRQSTAGTSTAVTPVARNALGTETVQATAVKDCAAEPTTVGVVYRTSLHPQASLELPLDLVVAGGTRLGLRLTAAATVNADATFEFEE